LNETFRLKPPRIIPIHICLRLVPDVPVTLRTSAISSGRRTTACVRHVCVQLRMIFLPSGKYAPFSLSSFVSSQPKSTFLAFVLVIYRSLTSSHLTLYSVARKASAPYNSPVNSVFCLMPYGALLFSAMLKVLQKGSLSTTLNPQSGRPGAAFVWPDRDTPSRVAWTYQGQTSQVV